MATNIPPNTEAIPPGQERSVEQQLAYGRDTWRRIFDRWSSQWSQPKLITLTRETLGQKNALHSSQIAGFQANWRVSPALNDPAPKVFIVLGLFNLALAKSQGFPDLPEDVSTCPQKISDLWKEKKYLMNLDGTPMSSQDIWNTFAGFVDFGVPEAKKIPIEYEQDVSNVLGAYLRKKFAEKKIDFLDPQEFLKLTKQSELIPEMILNRRVAGEDLIKGLDRIGSSVNESGDDLWQFVISPLLAELSEKK
tara:strand:- start:146 stop:895 length:750 start_codon:yes stop_codon:yes gene_type:complete